LSVVETIRRMRMQLVLVTVVAKVAMQRISDWHVELPE
jgi:D-arabinose 5-phosphate isomerase GutQ